MLKHTRTHTQSPIEYTIHGRLGAEERDRRDCFWETLANTDQLFFSLARQAHQPVLNVTSESRLNILQIYFLTDLYI